MLQLLCIYIAEERLSASAESIERYIDSSGLNLSQGEPLREERSTSRRSSASDGSCHLVEEDYSPALSK